MLYPQAKERVERFKLALRMGLPIFSLSVILIFIGLSEYFNTIPLTFFIIAIAILGVMIYFIFYLIYIGFEERVTDPITCTFTREYLLSLFKKKMTKNKSYTIALITIENLHDINKRYNTVNGDKVLKQFARHIGRYLKDKGINKIPIGHFKGGDFLIGLPGKKSEFATLFDLLLIKSENLIIDDIEIHVSGAMVDSTLSQDVDQLIARVFDLQIENKAEKSESEEEINPSQLELSVTNAIKERKFSMQFQPALENKEIHLLESSVKLHTGEGKLIHQKSYIPVINRLGLSREFDTMLLEYLIDICCSSEIEDMKFALTLFPSTIRNHTFFYNVQMLFSNNIKAKGHIVFVLGEQEYYTQISRYNDVLQSYRRMGILIAIDRFGTYQTSMMYLKELGVDIMRFDLHYGKEIKQRGYQQLLKGLNMSAQLLGAKTWVRMIEDEEAMAIAESIGVDFIQGNQIGRIAPLEEIMK